jgi:DNA polymerase-3 subunit delta
VSSPVPDDGDSAPTVYLIHGDDEFSIREYLARFEEKLDSASAVQMDVVRFSSGNFDLSALSEATTTLPFFSPRRLVIMSDVLKIATGPNQLDPLLDLLEHIPPTTALVLVAHAPLDQDSRGRHRIHPLLQWAQEHPRTAFVRKFAAPHGRDFVRWIQSRCGQLGGSIDQPAAYLLMELTAEDALIADQELHKLLDYVDRQRAIRELDITILTPLSGQSDVFAMVDALGSRQGAQALIHLHRLLESEPVLYAFAMILRQFRLLLQAREALQQGRDPRQAMKAHPFVIRKAAKQARQFPLTQLEEIYHQLLNMDVRSKTGRDDLEVALDRLIASLASS